MIELAPSILSADIRHVSDGHDLLYRNVQQFRHREHDPTLVGLRMRHIKVVGLRACCGDVRPAVLNPRYS